MSASREICHSSDAKRLRIKGGWGSIDAHVSQAELRPGPSTLRAALAWDQDICNVVTASYEQKARLFDILEAPQGLHMYSDYSGWDCPRWAVTGVAEMLQAMHGVHPAVSFKRACDVDPVPQTVLSSASMELDHGESCVFSNLEDRLSREVRSALDSMEPDASEPKEMKQQAYAAMFDYLRMDTGSFKRSATCPCLVHGKDCPVFDFSEGKDEKPLREPLRLLVAGNSCPDWSLAGLGAKEAGKTQRTAATFKAERVSDLEDVFIQECTERYPVDTELRQPLSKTHLVLSIHISSELLGYPCRRPRSFSAGLRLGKVAWAGPANYVQDFAEKFHRSLAADGDLFFQAPENVIDTELREMAGKRGNYFPEGIDMTQLPPDSFLPPSVLAGMSEWEKMRPAKQSLNGCFIANILNTPGFSSCGPLFPTQCTTGITWSWKKGRPATRMEYMMAHGFPIDGSWKETPSVAFMRRLACLPPAQVKHMSGNGMHLAVIGSWIFYVLSNIVVIKDGAKVPPTILDVGDDSDSERE